MLRLLVVKSRFAPGDRERCFRTFVRSPLRLHHPYVVQILRFFFMPPSCLRLPVSHLQIFNHINQSVDLLPPMRLFRAFLPEISDCFNTRLESTCVEHGRP